MTDPAPPLREQLRTLTPAQVRQLLAAYSAEELEALRFDWLTWARPEQLEPAGDWLTWLILSGRGWGKSRTGSEWLRRMARENPGARLAIVCRTSADCRDVAIEGESGIMAVCPPAEKPLFEPSKRRLTWRNGSQATAFSADEADQLRGPQFHFAWVDELASYANADEVWVNLMMALRLGQRARALVSTTPRPVPIIRKLIADPTTHVTRGSTYENAGNLSPTQIAKLHQQYEGTRIGRQELHGELLEDTEGALWNRELLDTTRVKVAPEMRHTMIGVDPSVTSGKSSALCGVSVCGEGVDGQYYVIADLSGKLSPDAWARRVVSAYKGHGASRVIAEGNQGGELVEQVLRTVDRNLPIKRVHASRGKIARAEPIAALFEQHRAHIVGSLPQLEDELCSFTGEGGEASPDRLDAMTWALTELSGHVSDLDYLRVMARRGDEHVPRRFGEGLFD